METYEARLLDRLKDYYNAKKDMEEALFDIEEITKNYPILEEVKANASKKSTRKIRAVL